MNIIFIKTIEHMELTFLSLFFAMVIAVPLGIYLARSNGKIASVLLRLTAMIQTIPGLALIALIIVALAALQAFVAIPTTGAFPAVIVLTLYALLPILMNTCTGIQQVSTNVTSVARAMGMTPMQVLFYIEIPLSLPVLINGIRIALVSTIGMGTLTSLVGSGGLGDLIVQGLRTMQLGLILTGTLPAALLAILFDVALGRVSHYFSVDT